MKRGILFLIMLLGIQDVLHAQTTSTAGSAIASRKSDQLQIVWDAVTVDAATKAVIVHFQLTNLLEEERELKLNVFASQLINKKEEGNLFTTLQLGRVTVQLKDRQNYMHYLLPSQTPIKGTMRVEGFNGGIGQIAAWKLVFEDRVETGRFIEVVLPYKAPK
jgi:hypothetical protein